MAVPIEILFSDLEPVSGAGLAVCLAYLALERFRYRRLIEDAGHSVHKIFKNDAKLSGDEELEALNDLKWLCREDCNGHTPRGFGPFFYRFWYRRQADEIIIAVLAVITAFTLFAGVGIKINAWKSLSFLNYPAVINVAFYLCLTAIIFPPIMVICGRRCVDWGTRFSSYCEDQITKILATSARSAESPATKK